MKTRRLKPLLLSALLLTAAPAWAGAPSENKDPAREEDADILKAPLKLPPVDLNGDGKPDDITLTPVRGTYNLTVNGDTLYGDDESDEAGVRKVTVIDLDKSDPWKELAVLINMPFDDQRVTLFGFDGRRLHELGSVDAIDQAHGNGILVEGGAAAFWVRREKYVLQRKKWKLEKVPQQLYAVDQTSQVRGGFPLWLDRKSKRVVAQVAPGTEIRVLAAELGQKGEDVWYLVKTASGLLGWTTASELHEFAIDLTFNG